MRRSLRYSKPLIWAIEQKMRRGMNTLAVARTYGIPASTANDWRLRRKKDDEEGRRTCPETTEDEHEEGI